MLPPHISAQAKFLAGLRELNKLPLTEEIIEARRKCSEIIELLDKRIKENSEVVIVG